MCHPAGKHNSSCECNKSSGWKMYRGDKRVLASVSNNLGSVPRLLTFFSNIKNSLAAVADRNPTAFESAGQRHRLSIPTEFSDLLYFCMSCIVMDESVKAYVVSAWFEVQFTQTSKQPKMVYELSLTIYSKLGWAHLF